MAWSVADGDADEPERRTAEYCAAAQNSAMQGRKFLFFWQALFVVDVGPSLGVT
jgi:hypothetical protein